MAFDVEQLFGAMDIILEQRLQSVNFDKTIICTIVDDSDKRNGCYIVTDGSMKFKAYVNDTTYRNDDQVRVSILNGDFSEKKFIVGKYIADEDDSPITYKSPLESVIPITGNLFEPENGKNNLYGMRANSDTIEQCIWQIDLSSNSKYRDLQANGIYNTIIIKADFKTLLSHYDLISGNYGLRLNLYIQPTLENSTQRILRYITLDSSEMLGNPYSFSVFSAQAKKADIISTGIISEMSLVMYQSINGDRQGSRFIDYRGEEIPVNQKLDDILIKNIEIGFGSDIEKVADNTLEIFSSSPPYYVYGNPTDETNKKEIEMLWFNKTENNEYLGFRDGLYDLDYDEIQYLKAANLDARLMSQKGRTDTPSDANGLKMAADLKDAKPILIKTRDYLTKEVASVLQGLQRQVKITESISNKLLEIINTTDGILVTQWNAANDAIEKWNAAYTGILQYAFDKQYEVQNPSQWKAEWNTDYYKKFQDAINTSITSIEEFFEWFAEQVADGGPQTAHRGNYDLYLYRVNKELDVVKSYLAHADSLLIGNHEKLQDYNKNNYVFVEYKEKDLSGYNNKYSIYWYRYDRSYKMQFQVNAEDNPDGTNPNDEFNYGRFMGDGWQRITITDENGIELKNFGLPRNEFECLDENGEPWYDENNQPVNSSAKKYYPTKALGQTVIRTMDPNFIEEKYIAVLFYNHEMYKSNVLVFTNSEPELIIPEGWTGDSLRIEHDVYSMEHYQVYNEYNQLRSLEDGGKVRQLKCYYDGLHKGDEALVNAGLYWYIPNHNSMLTFDVEDLKERGFTTDADEPTDQSINGYTYFYKKLGQSEEAQTDEDGNVYYTVKDEDRYFYYKIKPSLEKSALNNTILVKAYKENEVDPVEGETTMTFSTFGTNGTKYTLSIVPSGSQVAVGGKDKPLKLTVMLKDSQNEPIDIVDISTPGTEYAYGFSIENWKTPNAFSHSLIHRAPLEGEEPNTYVSGLEIGLTAETIEQWRADTPYFGIINAKVHFQIPENNNAMEGENEINNIVTDENGNPVTDENGIVQTKIDNYQKYRVVDLNTLYAIPYSSSDSYYMSGATCIVYNNQGTISYVSEDKYQLYLVNDETNAPVDNQVWRIEYYDSNGKWVNEKSDDWPMLLNYMPVLNSENRLTPAPMYIEGLDYTPVVICTVDGDIAWTQPIIITQNRYASPTLNDWNGSLTIDEKNGTILATAVGAGKKEADNSFSGVLMGDIAKGYGFDPDNMSGLGLYGFNNGAQSFCLNVDGKAFFGKAGRGRIYIDGDNGTISSASFQQNRNYDENGNFMGDAAAGMLIDLDDGFIHMRGTKFDEASGKYQPDQSIKDDETTSYAQAEILITVGEGDDYQITNADGTVTDVDNTAYLKIRSAKQYDEDHYLIYVGSEKYYLQTDDYNSVFYSFTEGADVDDSAAGANLNLANGHFDAYNFKLSSKNIFINSANETGNYSTEPYFVIRDVKEKEDGSLVGINLLYAGANEYYLKSNDFVTAEEDTEGNGKGIKITLKDYGSIPTGIEAYNFNLRAGSVGSSENSDYAIVLSDSGEPYLQINTAVTKENTTEIIPLVLISKTKQEFQSSDYSDPSEDTHGSGIKLSLSDKYLKAYSGFTLQAYYIKDNVTYPNYIRISSDSNSDPFYIFGDEYTYVAGTDENGNNINATGHKMFKVGWDGSITAEGGHFKNITAEGGTFSGNITATGTISGGTITGASIYAKYLYAGGGGGSKDSYILHATPSSVTINGATITAGGGDSGGGGGGGGGGASYGLDPQGNLKATNANLTSLTVRKQALFTDSCQTKIEGALGINTAPAEGYDMKANGNIFVGGNTEIEGNTEITGNTEINGTTKMTGLVAIGTNPTNYKLEVLGTTYLNGNVGIGTAPQDGSKLSVSGGIYLTGTSARLTIPSAGSLYFNDITKTLPQYLEDATVGKVKHTLTLQIDSSTKVTFDGSADKTFNVVLPTIPDLSDYATESWVEKNYCGVNGSTINGIKNRLKALEDAIK